MRLCKGVVINYWGEGLSVVKTWLQLILTKNYINDNYTKCVRPIFTKLGTMQEQRSVNILLHIVAMEPVM